MRTHVHATQTHKHKHARTLTHFSKQTQVVRAAGEANGDNSHIQDYCASILSRLLPILYLQTPKGIKE